MDQGHIAAFVSACRRVAAHRLVQCSSGNLSWRTEGGRMLATASGSWLGEMRPEQVAVCRIEDGVSENGVKPTVEIVFHAGILRARPELNVVLHFQSPCATALACSRPETVNFQVIPEVPWYIGEIATVPYHPPGSRALGAAVVSALARSNLAVLDHHGQVTVGATFDEALQRAVFFELACEVILKGGPGVVPFPSETAASLARHEGRGA